MKSQIAGLQYYIHDWAKQKGWWDHHREFSEMIALVHSEASEALEEWRDRKSSIYWSTSFWDEKAQETILKPEGIGPELADILIRVLDMAEYYEIDLTYMLNLKMEYNRKRPWRHGGKRA